LVGLVCQATCGHQFVIRVTGGADIKIDAGHERLLAGAIHQVLGQ
jgi:hypothetical protein